MATRRLAIYTEVLGVQTMRVLIVGNWDWALWHFRLPLALALRERGWDVVLVCPPGSYVQCLQEEGFQVVPWHLRRRSLNPAVEGLALLDLLRIYRREGPDLVHHFTIKPIVYGTLAARLDSVPRVINTWTGLGWTFSGSVRARVLHAILLPFLRRLLRGPNVWTVFQNDVDSKRLGLLRLVDNEKTCVIYGSGVDTRRFRPAEGPKAEPPVVLMASRLLWDKGVGEFVEAARLLRDSGVEARFLIAGAPDPGNPACIPQKMVDRWHREGVVEFLGHREDMPELLRQASVAVLPTHHEGVPMFLLEAMASGVPVVATDIPGCRAAVEDGMNGFLVPLKDPKALAEAILRLLKDPDLRERMGQAGRERAVSRFDQQILVEQWLRFYERVLGRPVQE